MKTAGFDYIIIETVGVGQSEVEIAGLADATLVIMVPESGDEIQAIKSGIIEIADIFVINKSDRPGADLLFKTISQMVHERFSGKQDVPVIKTNALQSEGIEELIKNIFKQLKNLSENNSEILFQRTLHLAMNHILKLYDFNKLKADLFDAAKSPDFNVHKFLSDYYKSR